MTRRLGTVNRSGELIVRAKGRVLCRENGVALQRVWGAVRLSWWMTMLLHRFPNETPFEQRMRESQFDYLLASEHAKASLAEQSAGSAEQMKAQSWIRQMFEAGMALKAQHGARNVFDLSLGNPILEPPQAFHDHLRAPDL